MRQLGVALTLLPFLFTCGPARDGSERPALALLIVVDGLRPDLLDRYDRGFRGGFRRLRDRGLRFRNATVEHAITVSHAGHVTLATGRHPDAHGIVDAAFYVPRDGGRILVDAVADTNERVLGLPEATGASPRRVLAPGLAEWFASADTASRVLAVGSGNVSSLLHVFHAPADVYWYRGGRYVGSSFYRDALPGWVERFNRAELPARIEAALRWECSVPESLR